MKSKKLTALGAVLLSAAAYLPSESHAWASTCGVIGTPFDMWQMAHRVSVTYAESIAGYGGLYAYQTMTTGTTSWPYGPDFGPNLYGTPWYYENKFGFTSAQMILSWRLDGWAYAADEDLIQIGSTRIDCDPPGFWG